MQWKLFADLAELAEGKEVPVDAEPGDSVGDALDDLLAPRPDLEARVLDDDGRLRDHINVLRNGTDVFAEDGLDTSLEPGDELALFPPVSGG